MKKFLTILMLMPLIGCLSQQSNQNDLKERQDAFDYNVRQEYEQVSPSNVIFQPDEQIQALQNIEDQSLNPGDQTQQESCVDGISKQLRKDLRKTGIQVKEVKGQIDLIIPNKVAFGNNQSELQSKFEEAMNSVVKLLKECDETMIQIVGYMDNSNSFLIGKEVSLKNAEKIANYLRAQGINSERIIVAGAGADDPIATNLTISGRELNRRVELTIISFK